MSIDIAGNCMNANKSALIMADPVRAYLSAIGRKGSEVHQLSQDDRRLGVQVRLAKKAYIAQGFSAEAAHAKARANFRISPGGVLCR